MNTEGANGRADSTVGKIMEKVGHVVKNEGMVEKGHQKRVDAGLGQEDDGELEGKYAAN